MTAKHCGQKKNNNTPRPTTATRVKVQMDKMGENGQFKLSAFQNFTHSETKLQKKIKRKQLHTHASLHQICQILWWNQPSKHFSAWTIMMSWPTDFTTCPLRQQVQEDNCKTMIEERGQNLNTHLKTNNTRMVTHVDGSYCVRFIKNATSTCGAA